ncbi:MAG: SpoIIIAC/SpoIIIAD family protein [Lachnospiraceae bacterium]
MSIIKVCLFGITGLLLALICKHQKEEYSLFISMAVCLILIAISVNRLSGLLELIHQVTENIHMDTSYLKLLLKMTGITYAVEFSVDLCKDAGYQGIAKQLQIFGRLSILALGVPILTAFIKMISEFLS